MIEKPYVPNAGISYHFEDVNECEMCGDPVQGHKILGLRLNKTQGMKPRKKSGIAVSVRKCNKCGLIYSSPQPIPYDIQDHYGIAPESYWYPAYFTVESNYFSWHIIKAKEFIGFKPGMKALDIGAGIGKAMISMKNAGFDVWGLEPSKPYYERALTKMSIPGDRIQLGMVEEIEFEPGSFDFISFGAVFEHLYHPSATLEKVIPWLKPGGIIHIEVPSSNYLIAKLVNLYYQIIGTNYVCNISPMHIPFHMYEFSVRSFKELSKRLGYKLIEYQYHVATTSLLSRIFHPVINPIMKFTNTGMQITLWITK